MSGLTALRCFSTATWAVFVAPLAVWDKRKGFMLFESRSRVPTKESLTPREQRHSVMSGEGLPATARGFCRVVSFLEVNFDVVSRQIGPNTLYHGPP